MSQPSHPRWGGSATKARRGRGWWVRNKHLIGKRDWQGPLPSLCASADYHTLLIASSQQSLISEPTRFTQWSPICSTLTSVFLSALRPDDCGLWDRSHITLCCVIFLPLLMLMDQGSKTPTQRTLQLYEALLCGTKTQATLFRNKCLF